MVVLIFFSLLADELLLPSDYKPAPPGQQYPPPPEVHVHDSTPLFKHRDSRYSYIPDQQHAHVTATEYGNPPPKGAGGYPTPEYDEEEELIQETQNQTSYSPTGSGYLSGFYQRLFGQIAGQRREEATAPPPTTTAETKETTPTNISEKATETLTNIYQRFRNMVTPKQQEIEAPTTETTHTPQLPSPIGLPVQQKGVADMMFPEPDKTDIEDLVCTTREPNGETGIEIDIA